MSWLEIGLALYLLITLVGYIVGANMIGKRRVLWHCAGLILLGLHLVFEGYRMPMLLLYFMLIISTFGTILTAYRRKKLHQTTKASIQKRLVIGTIWGLLLLIALAVPAYVLPKVVLPSPTGPYAIGTTMYHWVDETRMEPFTLETDDHREVIVRVWYPGELSSKMTPASYAYDAEHIHTLIKGQPLYIKAILAAIKRVETHSYSLLPISQAQDEYPVLVLSPGLGASNFMYTSFTEQLASHGYVVAVIEHSYYTEIPTLFPDGRITEGKVEFHAEANDWESMNEHTQLWKDDVRFVLDRLEHINQDDPHHILTGKLDTNQIGMLGHSFGGATAAQVMHYDPRVLAGINMDGFPYGEKLDQGLINPFLFILSPDTDKFARSELEEKEWREYDLDSREAYEQLAGEFMLRKHGMLRNGGSEWVVQGTDHMSFSDVGMYSPLLGSFDVKLHREITEKLLTFFNEHVRK
ncbi:alpha/beta hydrolase family protein [Paenibacillus septentrionalis]|uniref:Alpha/beta hydrolase family protein n=1 Tax=Paenibacillus septentrionalis TaxID=429342 RepID=A0ABW1V4Z8_9BACL